VEPTASQLTVAHLAEQSSEPLQLNVEIACGRGIEHFPEYSHRAAQPDVAGEHRVDLLPDVARERGLRRRPCARRTAGRAADAGELGRVAGLPGARPDEAPRKPLGQRPCRRSLLDLDFAPREQPVISGGADVVVDELDPQHVPLRIDDAVPVATGPDGRDRNQRLSQPETGEQVGQFGRWRVRQPGAQLETPNGLGHFELPSDVVVAVPTSQRHPATQQIMVGGVAVDTGEFDRAAVDGASPATSSGAGNSNPSLTSHLVSRSNNDSIPEGLPAVTAGETSVVTGAAVMGMQAPKRRCCHVREQFSGFATGRA
jgi:hypothetical protein